MYNKYTKFKDIINKQLIKTFSEYADIPKFDISSFQALFNYQKKEKYTIGSLILTSTSFNLVSKIFYDETEQNVTAYLINIEIKEDILKNISIGSALLSLFETSIIQSSIIFFNSYPKYIKIEITKYKNIIFQLKRGFKFKVIRSEDDKLFLSKIIELLIHLNTLYPLNKIHNIPTFNNIVFETFIHEQIETFYKETYNKNKNNIDQLLNIQKTDIFKNNHKKQLLKYKNFFYKTYVNKLIDNLFHKNNIFSILQSLFYLEKNINYKNNTKTFI